MQEIKHTKSVDNPRSRAILHVYETVTRGALRMTVERITGSLLSFFLCFWAMSARPASAGPASAGPIVGVTFARSLYNIDPLTGNTSLLLPGCAPGCGPFLGASGSPDAGTIFASSIVNVHEINLTTFQDTALGGITHSFDLAFDRGTNTLFDTSGSALFNVHCPSPPGLCTETQVGPVFPSSHMQALGFVPGAGLYGVSDNFLYLINDSTGVTTPVGATGLSDPTRGITDLAFDTGTVPAARNLTHLLRSVARAMSLTEEASI